MEFTFDCRHLDASLIPHIFGEARLMYIQDCLMDRSQSFEIWTLKGGRADIHQYIYLENMSLLYSVTQSVSSFNTTPDLCIALVT